MLAFIGTTLLSAFAANATVIYNAEKYEACRHQQKTALWLAGKEVARKYQSDDQPNRAQLEAVLQALEKPAADDLDAQAIKSCLQQLSTSPKSPNDFLSFIDCGELGEDGLARFAERRGLSPRLENISCAQGFTPVLGKNFPADPAKTNANDLTGDLRVKTHYFAPPASCVKGPDSQDPLWSRMVSFMWHGRELNRLESDSKRLKGKQILDVDSCTKHFEPTSITIESASDPELAPLGKTKIQVRFATAMTCITQELGQNHDKATEPYGTGDPLDEDATVLSLIDASGHAAEWSCAAEQSPQD